jgi:hypothetical protein
MYTYTREKDKEMIKMTPSSNTPFQSLVMFGWAAIKSGGTIERVMMLIERDPMFQQGNDSLAEIKAEIEFWAGTPKKK